MPAPPPGLACCGWILRHEGDYINPVAERLETDECVCHCQDLISQDCCFCERKLGGIRKTEDTIRLKTYKT